jgi:hypothetical protein
VLLAPTSSLTAVHARTRTLSNQKQQWHSCPTMSETRTTPSWYKHSTPECQITMDLRPLPRNLGCKCLLNAIRDIRNNQIRRIHEKPLGWLWAKRNTRLVQDASKHQFLPTYDTACTSANQDADPKTLHFVFIQHPLRGTKLYKQNAKSSGKTKLRTLVRLSHFSYVFKEIRLWLCLTY